MDIMVVYDDLLTALHVLKAVPLQASRGPEGSRKLRFRSHDNGTGWW